MINIGIGTALISAILGYAVVFLGIVFLMAVIMLFGKIANKKNIETESVISAEGIEPKKVAAIMAAISEMQREA